MAMAILFFILLAPVVFWAWNKYEDIAKDTEKWRWNYGIKRSNKKNSKEKKH